MDSDSEMNSTYSESEDESDNEQDIERITCSMCGNIEDNPDCLEVCTGSKCYKNLCDDCIIDCNECKKIVCSDDSYSCYHCSENYCDSCIRHCDECDVPLCIGCIKDDFKKIVPAKGAKFYCKEQCEKLADSEDEEVEDN